MLLQSEAGIWAQAEARVFALLMTPNRTQRRLLAANRTIDRARVRVATLGRWLAAAADLENIRAARAVEREMREMARDWGETLRIKMPKQSRRAARADRRRALLAETPLARRPRAYQTPLRDSRGRIAVFFRVRYVGLKSKNWRPGLPADHIFYILREAALEEAGGEIIANMGETVEEIAACWRAIEEVELGYRANAKVQFRIILNLPHQLTPEQRREMVKEYCERTFGRLGLPYVAAIHKPDKDGDRRNYHAHICFSTRPCLRVGDHEWIIAQEKANGLDDKDGLMRLRALAAAHMNLACRDAGLTLRYTHLSYKARGIDAERQEHVGPAAMAAFRKGEDVAAVQRNEMLVESNEAAVACQYAAAEVNATERLAELLGQRVQLDELRARASARLRRLIPLRRLAENLAAKVPPAPAPTEAKLNVARDLAGAVRVRLQAAPGSKRAPRMAAVLTVKNRAEAAQRTSLSCSARAGATDAIARTRRLADAARVAARRTGPAKLQALTAARLRTTAGVMRAVNDELTASAIKLNHHIGANQGFSLALERIGSAIENRRAERAEEERREAQKRREVDRLREEDACRHASEQAEAAHRALQGAKGQPAPHVRKAAPENQGGAAETGPDRQTPPALSEAERSAIEKIVQFDSWVFAGKDGRYSVSGRSLAFLGVAPGLVESDAAQRVLARLADRQFDAVEPVLTELRWREGRLALDSGDPALRAKVALWGRESNFIAFACGVVPALGRERPAVPAQTETVHEAETLHPSPAKPAEAGRRTAPVPPWMRWHGPDLGG